MMIEVLKSKIHRVRVTQANLNYVGSITIDEDLMDAANMIEGEKVQILDINNGERFETYIIKGERGSGCICLNGAAARKVAVDDLVIIVSYALLDFEEAKTFKPWVIFPDSVTNHLIKYNGYLLGDTGHRVRRHRHCGSCASHPTWYANLVCGSVVHLLHIAERSAKWKVVAVGHTLGYRHRT